MPSCHKLCNPCGPQIQQDSEVQNPMDASPEGKTGGALPLMEISPPETHSVGPESRASLGRSPIADCCSQQNISLLFDRSAVGWYHMQKSQRSRDGLGTVGKPAGRRGNVSSYIMCLSLSSYRCTSLVQRIHANCSPTTYDKACWGAE